MSNIKAKLRELGWSMEFKKLFNEHTFCLSHKDFNDFLIYVNGFPIIANSFYILYKAEYHKVLLVRNADNSYKIKYRSSYKEDYLTLVISTEITEQIEKLVNTFCQPKLVKSVKRIRSMRPERIERLKSESLLYKNVEKFYLTNNQKRQGYYIQRNFIKRINLVKWKLFGK